MGSRMSDKQTSAILPAREIKFPLLRSGISADPIAREKSKEKEEKRKKERETTVFGYTRCVRQFYAITWKSYFRNSLESKMLL